jgi:hypothetical protein
MVLNGSGAKALPYCAPLLALNQCDSLLGVGTAFNNFLAFFIHALTCYDFVLVYTFYLVYVQLFEVWFSCLDIVLVIDCIKVNVLVLSAV